MAYKEMGKFSNDRVTSFETAKNKRKPWTFWDKVTFQGSDKQLVIEGGAIYNAPFAKGYLTHAAKTSTQSGITAVADVSSLSITWAAEIGRMYRIQAFIRFAKDASAADVVGYITDSVPITYAAATVTLAGNYTGTMMLTSLWEADRVDPGMKVRASSAIGAVSVVGSATGPSVIWVEDIGLA